jgi:hypothetical protein
MELISSYATDGVPEFARYLRGRLRLVIEIFFAYRTWCSCTFHVKTVAVGLTESGLSRPEDKLKNDSSNAAFTPIDHRLPAWFFVATHDSSMPFILHMRPDA